MHLTRSDFLDPDSQKLPLQKNLGDAFARVMTVIFGGHSARMIRELGIDKKTVQNVREGKAGASVITKTLHARQASHDDAWEMWLALGQEVIGESLEAFEERKIRQLIETAANARSLLEARQQRRQALAEKAALLVDGLAGRSADEDRKEAG